MSNCQMRTVSAVNQICHIGSVTCGQYYLAMSLTNISPGFLRSLRDQKCFCKPTFIQNLSIIDAFISENNATASSSNIICSVTELCVDALPVLSSSQQKNIFKIFNKLLAKYSVLFKGSIGVWIDGVVLLGDLEVNHLIFISLLIDEVKQSHKILTPNLLKLLSVAVSSLEKQLQSPQPSSEICLKSSKLFLQIFRTFREELIEIANHSAFDVYQECFFNVADVCFTVLNHSKSQLLSASKFCSSAIAYMLSCHNDVKTVHQNLEKLMSPENESIEAEIIPGVVISINEENLLVTSFWIFSGILSCYPKLLFDDNSSSVLVTSSFHTILKVCSSEVGIQYQGFTALQLWYKQLLRSPCVTTSFIDSEVVLLTIDLIWKNWDSQIVGAIDILMQTFSSVLDVVIIVNQSYVNNIVSHLINTPNHVKGRYGPLAICVNKFGYEVVLNSDPQFICNLVDVLGVNHLAPSIAKVYKCMISCDLKDANHSFDPLKWELIFGKPLVKALLSNSRLIRKNALSYLVPANLNLLPSVLPNILDSISSTSSSAIITEDTKTAAIVGVLKVGLSSGVVQFKDIDKKLLQQAFYSCSDDTRARAFWIVCNEPKKSEHITKEELSFLYDHLPLNLNSDCAAFRHELIFCLNAMLERVQCGVIAAAKQNNSTYSEMCLVFVEWLHQLCIDSLSVCFTYQRKSTALFLYKSLLNNFSYNDEIVFKKKLLPREDWNILETVLKESEVNLLSTSNAATLLSLVTDVAEIRVTVLNLLSSYFLPIILKNFQVHLKEKCLSLLNSLKSQDSESGAQLAQFYFTYIVANGAQSYVSEKDSKETLLSGSMFDQHFVFLSQLFDFIEVSYQHFRDDFLFGAHHFPIHGWLLALSFCLDSCPSLAHVDAAGDASDKTWAFLTTVVDLLSNIVHYFLDRVFSCSERKPARDNEDHQYVASADFREMSVRICEIICDSKKGNNDICFSNEEILLSQDFEVVLSGSWLALKNSCACLSSWGCFVLRCEFVDCITRRELESHLSNLTSLFATALSMCRHRGVIESCYLSFVKYITSLFRSETFSSLPKVLLESLLKSQNQKRDTLKIVEGGSITRRSAGIPLVIDAILTANTAAGYSNDMFTECIEVLLGSLVYLKEIDEKMVCSSADLPQVDALYILKSIFQNNKLGSLAAVHLPPVFMATLDCLDSSLWVVRNAAVCLLSILSSRMLGQKHIEKKFSNSLTASEFFARYPNLLQYFRQLFNDGILLSNVASSDESRDKQHYFLKPSIYPIISLLSYLAYNNVGSQNKLDCSFIISAANELLVCRFFPVRSVSAELLLALHSTEEIILLISRYIKSLPQNPNAKDTSSLCQNELHGWLHLTLMVLSHTGVRTAQISGMGRILVDRKWLALLECNPCPFTAALYLNVVVTLVEEKYIDSAGIHCDHIIASTSVEHLRNRVGITNYVEAFIKYLIAANCFTDSSMLMKILISTGSVVQTKCFELLAISSKVLSQLGASILACICQFWKTQRCSALLEVAILTVLVKLSSLELKKMDDIENLHLISSHVFSASLGNCLSLKCVRLKAMSCVIMWEIATDCSFPSIINHIGEWINELNNSTFLTRAPEPLRCCAAESLDDAGAKILHWIRLHRSAGIGESDVSKLLDCATSICYLSLLLLHDEQSEIREPVCGFAASLQDYLNINQLQRNYATTVILTFFTTHFSSVQLLDKFLLLCTNVTFPSSSKKQGLYQQEAFNLYVEQEQIALVSENYAQVMVEKVLEVSEERITGAWKKSIQMLTRLHELLKSMDLHQLVRFVICSLAHVKIVVNVAEACSVKLEKLSSDIFEDLIKLQVYFGCKKGELDRFFDRPIEESRLDRFPSLLRAFVILSAVRLVPFEDFQLPFLLLRLFAMTTFCEIKFKL